MNGNIRKTYRIMFCTKKWKQISQYKIYKITKNLQNSYFDKYNLDCLSSSTEMLNRKIGYSQIHHVEEIRSVTFQLLTVTTTAKTILDCILKWNIQKVSKYDNDKADNCGCKFNVKCLVKKTVLDPYYSRTQMTERYFWSSEMFY